MQIFLQINTSNRGSQHWPHIKITGEISTRWIQIRISEADGSAERCFKSLHTCIFIEALFTIAKGWKSPKCPSMSEWPNKMYEHAGNTAQTLSEGLMHARTRVSLKNITLSERNETRHSSCCVNPFISNIPNM